MRPLLIFSGSNDRAVIAFCRFCIDSNIEFYIVANGDQDLIFDSIYKSNLIATREKNKLSIETILDYSEQVKKKSNSAEIVILPSTEFINRLLVKEQKVLNEHKVYTGLCTDNLYQLISDKYSFGELCQKYNINLPVEFTTPPTDFPYIIKPKVYQDSNNNIDKPAVIYSEQEAAVYLKGKEEKDYFFQEYVGGQSIYLLYNFCKNGDYSVYSQENLMQQSNGGSMLISKSTNYHQDAIAAKFANLFINEGYCGLIMVEVKLYNGEYYMIEANPRLWGPSQLILDAGMDLFAAWALENKLIEEKGQGAYKSDVLYFWEGGLTIEKERGTGLKYYNNYDKRIFDAKYEQLKSIEVYNRQDTEGIYKKENRT